MAEISLPTGDVNPSLLLKEAHAIIHSEAMILTGDIQRIFYSRHSGFSLGVRTGQARRGWQVKSQGDKVVSIINNVPHADQSERRVIKPVKGDWLAIPVGPALTKSGVARFNGPRDVTAPDLRVIQTDNNTCVMLGKKKGNKKKEDIFFVLKKEVVIPARTKGLTPFVMKRAETIGTELTTQLTKYVETIGNALDEQRK